MGRYARIYMLKPQVSHISPSPACRLLFLTAGGHVERKTQGLGSSSAAMDGGAVTQGGGTGTGNTTGSTESITHGCAAWVHV